MAAARPSWRQALLLVAGGVVATALAIEIGVRIATGSLFTWGGNERDDNLVTDPMLGRVYAYQGQGRHPTKHFVITIGEHGTRTNGAPPAAGRPLTLAVGDSFAFGDGVDDDETWPAALEKLAGGRVVNAGMIGFGLDQAVLRAERLVETYHPDTIVVAFIPHDVRRCELSYWSGFSKPYFDIDGAGLRLHPAEVPTPPPFAGLRKVLAQSMALDRLFPRFLHWQGPDALAVHDRGEEVACLLMARLAELGRRHDVRIVVLAHPQAPDSTPEDVQTAATVLACAADNGLTALDLFPVFTRLPLDERQRLFDRHLTPAGNRLVAGELAALLGGSGSD